MVDAKILEEARRTADDAGLKVVDQDLERPWGGFLVFDGEQSKAFLSSYFPTLEFPKGQKKMSPKFLIVAPGSRLSWQYHDRRSEHWHVLRGPVGVVVSDTDEPGVLQVLQENEETQIAQGKRHRLVGLDDWGVVAEIWVHTDSENPSDESDIVRLQDDYSRA